MKIDDALTGVARLFLDTAPVIYFIEKNSTYQDRVKAVFDRIDAGSLEGAASVVTLAEALVQPFRLGLDHVADAFVDLLTRGHGMHFVNLDTATARQAAELRARYNLTLTDSLQVAAALQAGCGAILTNDLDLKRVAEIPALVLDELTL